MEWPFFKSVFHRRAIGDVEPGFSAQVAQRSQLMELLKLTDVLASPSPRTPQEAG